MRKMTVFTINLINLFSFIFYCLTLSIIATSENKRNSIRIRRGGNVILFDMFGLPKYVSNDVNVTNKPSTESVQKRTSLAPANELLEKSEFKSAIHDSVLKRTLKYNLVTETPMKWPKIEQSGHFQVVIPNQQILPSTKKFGSSFSFSVTPIVPEEDRRRPSEESLSIEREINLNLERETKLPDTTKITTSPTEDFNSVVSRRFHSFGFEPILTETPFQISTISSPRSTFTLVPETINSVLINDNQKPTVDTIPEPKPPSISPDNFDFSSILSQQRVFQQFPQNSFPALQAILPAQKPFQQYLPSGYSAPTNGLGSSPTYTNPSFTLTPPLGFPTTKFSTGQNNYGTRGPDTNNPSFGSKPDNQWSNGAYIPSGQPKNNGAMTCYCPCPGGYMIPGSSYQAPVQPILVSTNSPCSGKISGNESTGHRHSVDTGGQYIFGPPLRGR